MAIRSKLREELMKLPADERLKLADELYSSIDPNDDCTDLDHAWADEIRTRIEQIRAGVVEGVPAERVFASVRERLASRRDQ